MSNYPMIEVSSPFGGSTYRPMTQDEYEGKINFFRSFIQKYQNDNSRCTKEYIAYLQRWFSNEECDGLPNFQTRYEYHRLPMSMNIYLYG